MNSLLISKNKREERLARRIENTLRETFGEDVFFYHEEDPDSRTNTYYVSTNTSPEEFYKTNQKIYSFINTRPKLPPAKFHEGLHEKDGFVYSGLAKFSQDIRRLGIVGQKVEKSQQEHAHVFFLLNQKLAKLVVDGVVNRVRIDDSYIKQFAQKQEPSQLRLAK